MTENFWMNYTISFQRPNLHYVDIVLKVKVSSLEFMEFQLPSWRPGRYDLANFAKNIQKWAAFDENNRLLRHKKISKDLWRVECKGVSSIELRYNYFANELNAGSTYVDEHQLYINPVNCLVYPTDRIDKTCQLKIEVPDTYKVATSLKKKGKRTYSAKDYDELADSPIIASPDIKHDSYESNGTKFHLWFQGEFKPEWKHLKDTFMAFTKEQIKLFGEFPTGEYHFLFQILTGFVYHGVEHSASTVIALGPSYSLLKKKDRYLDLLGVSSHELFHTWNVKRIRPQEMVPYNFTKENYTRLGYLTEGATTWYGDLMLYRSNVFSEEEYFKTFEQLLNRHFNNPGVKNLSVADSSFDTWLDGYSVGVPNRKSSIYTEGALITFLIDVEIRRSTNDKKSFDNVLRVFYSEFYKQGRGITEKEYRNTVEGIAKKDLSLLFDGYVNGTKDFSKIIEKSLKYLGLQMATEPTPYYHESYFGIRLKEGEVYSIYPSSIAEKGGLSIGDRPLTINSIEIKNNLSDWLEYFVGETIKLGVIKHSGTQVDLNFKNKSNDLYYRNYRISKLKKLSKAQEKAYRNWITTN